MPDPEFERDRAAAIHFLDLAECEFHANIRALYDNADETMLRAADAALKHSDAMSNNQFISPRRSPNAKGSGRTPKQDGIQTVPAIGSSSSPRRHTYPRRVPPVARKAAGDTPRERSPTTRHSPRAVSSHHAGRDRPLSGVN
ncbi:MAG: hypothetical protein KF705_09395 [Phycisphaeraceae bacterium]|nr:hypothetical protein [Phycisphaeraceae bacterium]